MRKTFHLTHEKIKPARLIEGAKHEVRKYLKRERKKSLPEGMDYWDFDCRYGATDADAKAIHVAEITQYIDEAEAQQLTSFYLEILARPAKRMTRAVVETADEETVSGT